QSGGPGLVAGAGGHGRRAALGQLDGEGETMSRAVTARCILPFVLLLWPRLAWGHIGSPNAIYEGTAGSVPVRVSVRPPGVVPGDSLATARLALPPALGVVLVALGVLLFLPAVSAVGAAVRESVLDPGLEPTRRRKWIGRGAIAMATAIFALAVIAGRAW